MKARVSLTDEQASRVLDRLLAYEFDTHNPRWKREMVRDKRMTLQTVMRRANRPRLGGDNPTTLEAIANEEAAADDATLLRVATEAIAFLESC